MRLFLNVMCHPQRMPLQGRILPVPPSSGGNSFVASSQVSSPNYNLYRDIQQAINLKLFSKFAERESEFAFPTWKLHVYHDRNVQLMGCKRLRNLSERTEVNMTATWDQIVVTPQPGSIARQVQESSADFVVLTPSQLPRDQHAMISDSLASAEEKLTILPLGTSGELLWSRLPWKLASLVSLQQAALILKREEAAIISQESPWKILAESPDDQMQVISFQETALDQAVLPSLSPASQRAPKWVSEKLNELVAGRPSRTETIALRAGVLQFWDDLDASHSSAQSIEGEGTHHNGDYWHAIMHRREPDYGNSKYWFRRVGHHPIFEELAERAADILREHQDWLSRVTTNAWNPFAFVDMCEEASSDEDSPLGLAARRIQAIEMTLLLEQTWQDG